MNERIVKALKKLFERHRIVFWYDKKRELRAEFDAIDIFDVEKIEILNNEFGIKYRVLRECPTQKFLLFHDGPQPDDLNNWLLDILLANGEFHADQNAIWLSEMDLGHEFIRIVEEHTIFFNIAKRRETLKKILAKGDTENRILLKMIAICVNTEPQLDEIIVSLLEEYSRQKNEKFDLILQCGLDTLLWQQMNRHYGYESSTPGMRDFAIKLFKSCYDMGIGNTGSLTTDSLVFLKRWKDGRYNQEAFNLISSQCAKDLKIKEELEQCDYRDIVEIDYFSLIDRKITKSLIEMVEKRTISVSDCEVIVRQRRLSHWYDENEDIYLAILHAAEFLHAIDESDLNMSSLTDGIQRYTRIWSRIDYLYRKFIYHTKKCSQITFFDKLNDMVENHYSTSYLLKLNDNWQQYVDECIEWEADPVLMQRRFYNKKINEIINSNQKVYVIISDALRYEIGEELVNIIRKEDRYDAEIEPMLTMLPSYTQLGMAALLPNKEIYFADNSTGAVYVDGHSTQGTANRTKILNKTKSGTALAMKAEEFMSQTREEHRNLLRDNNLIYIYHNGIDAVGDKSETEEKVFDAAEESLDTLIKLIKKLTGANATNIFVTSDHGFIYQNKAIDESDFLSVDASGVEILYRDRRFVIGKKLDPHSSFKLFKMADIGLTGDMEVLIPKSINRLRLKGSGSRYVHGGASLQEVVVPVIKINKKRQTDIRNVDVDILRGATAVISSGQISVAFYQVDAVTEKVQARKLRAGIYTQDGKIVSEQHELLFDITSDNPRDREKNVRFMLTRDADEANNQDVILRLEEQIAGTSHFREYKVKWYKIRRSFTLDFEM